MHFSRQPRTIVPWIPYCRNMFDCIWMEPGRSPMSQPVICTRLFMNRKRLCLMASAYHLCCPSQKRHWWLAYKRNATWSKPKSKRMHFTVICTKTNSVLRTQSRNLFNHHKTIKRRNLPAFFLWRK